MGGLDEHKPAMAMVGLQFSYACTSLFTRMVLVQGMSPRVFVVYRQAIATLVMTPIVYFSRRNSNIKCSLNLRSFSLIFLNALIGVTLNQNLFFEGLYLSSTSVSTAMSNLVPAVTFVLASILGMEKVNIRSFISSAKIIGTVICVGGAISMALLKGPKLLNMELLPSKSIFGAGGDNWLLGCLSLFGSSWFWSFWVIMQNDSEAWYLHSVEEFGCCLYAGTGSAVSFFVQTWCISQRGPLFSAMFNPLCTVITTIIASVFLHEELYTGSLLGAFAVVIGLYVVLWGKAEDLKEIKQEAVPKLQHDQEKMGQVLINESSEKKNSKVDLEEPLLS
ncbi:hypothetical protein RGQ29_013117 [Quercus rubra]|uniref:WAT1-related protein n=1 Tax=Quercus rubra TaxID=3512 RepID=A0AAN7JBH0_QUERU|nr:hypothetical protein RGQ29_013117 [Quercus rubra]